MALSYSLKIVQLDSAAQSNGLADVVERAHWAYTAVAEDGRKAAFGGATDIGYAAEKPFTAYVDLTEEQVVEWVLATWTAEYRTSIEAILSEQLATSALPLPWVATTAEPTVA